MFFDRPDNVQLAKYTGPYERWTFSAELGFPFAFPAIRNGVETHYTALMEGTARIAEGDTLEVRVPPMWTTNPPVTPFAMFDPDGEMQQVESQDVKLTRMLQRLGQARFRLNMPIAPATWPQTYEPDAVLDGWTPPATSPRMIIGVVDDGLPFLHTAFLDQDGKSRIAACWMQAARAPDIAAVPFGREVFNTEIDTLRATHGTHERAAYRAAGAIDRTLPELGTVMEHSVTHGAHILGLAAGNDPRTGPHALPDDAMIIAVQLPNTVAWDTSGFGKEMMMLSAIEYIFHRARAIAAHYGLPELPAAVNFSYGWSANRHDGESSFERGVEALITQRQAVQPDTYLIMPTGNNFANRMHGRFMAPDTDAAGEIHFGWQLKPDDRTSSFLEIWLPTDMDTPQGWEIVVTPPNGIALTQGGTLPISADPAHTGGDPRRFDELEIDGLNIGQVSADKHNGNRWRVMLAMTPTALEGDPKRRCPVGLWRITLRTGTQPLEPHQAVDVWVQRDDDPTQLGTGGQQSFLVDFNHPLPPRPLEPAPLTPVRGYGCLNGIGTAPAVTRVAGHIGCAGKPTEYSGASAIAVMANGTILKDRAHPTVSAIADQGHFRRGLPSIGVTSGSGARIIGTSAASAAVTRAVALNILRDKPAFHLFEPTDFGPGTSGLEDAQTLSRMGLSRAPAVCKDPSATS